jgi:hypothetical protein
LHSGLLSAAVPKRTAGPRALDIVIVAWQISQPRVQNREAWAEWCTTRAWHLCQRYLRCPRTPDDQPSSCQTRALSLIPSKIVYSSNNIVIVIMKWLLALAPLVAAAPALSSFDSGDAPDPGQVDLCSSSGFLISLTAAGENF